MSERASERVRACVSEWFNAVSATEANLPPGHDALLFSISGTGPFICPGTDTAGHTILFEFQWLFNSTLTAVISWRGRPDNLVAVGLNPKNSSSAGGALNHSTTGRPRWTYQDLYLPSYGPLGVSQMLWRKADSE